MEISTRLNKIDFVYHLADLHFPKNIVSDEYTLDRYNAMIKNILNNAVTKTKTTVAVITGDLLNNNDQGTPDLIKMCIKFINKLADIMPVIIIAGNHDYNHTTGKTWFDVLDAATSEDAHFLTNSGWYILTAKNTRLLIGFQSITDKYYSFFYNNQNVRDVMKQYNCKHSVALFHGNVAGCRINNSKIFTYDESTYNDDSPNTDYNINKNWMKEYNIVLLGHIHERQKIEPNIYYAGSTIQRTFAESYDNHGGLLLKISTCQYAYINYPDPYANVVLNEIDAKLHVELPSPTRKYLLRIHHTDALSVHDRKEIEDYYNTHYNIISISWQYHPTVKAQQQTIKLDDIFNNSIANYSIDVQDTLRKMNSNSVSTITTTGISIELLSLSWKNVFCYGNDISKLKFDDNKITVVSAPNTSGKSTIWRIILVALYADMDQRVLATKLIDNIVNKQAKEGWINLHCTINNDDVVIYREFKMNTQRCTHTYSYVVNGMQVDKSWLKNKLIPYDTFTSNYSLTKDSDSIYSKTLGKLQKYINDTFNLDAISDTITSTQECITRKTSELTVLTAKRDTIADKLEDIKSTDVDSISEQIKEQTTVLQQLHKPVNPYSHLPNNHVTDGTIIDINIDPQEYSEISSCYKYRKPSRNMITIYNKYNTIDLQHILQLYDNIEQSNKVKKYISQNNIAALSELLKIHHDTLVDKCWKSIQPYEQVINDEQNIINSDMYTYDVTIDDCADYILQSNSIVLPIHILTDWILTSSIPTISEEMTVYTIESSNNVAIPSNKYVDIIHEIYDLYICIRNTYNFDVNDSDNNSNQGSFRKWMSSNLKNIKETVNKIKKNFTLRKYDEKLRININEIFALMNRTDYSDMTKEELIDNLQKCVQTLRELRSDKEFNQIFSEKEFISNEEIYNIYIQCIQILNDYNRYALEQNTILYYYHVNKLSKYYTFLQQKIEQNDNVVEQAKKLICGDSDYSEFKNICNDISSWCCNILYTVTETYSSFDSENEEYMTQKLNITATISQLNNDIKHYTTDLQKYTNLLNDVTCKCNDTENDIDINKKYKLSLENTRLQIIKNGLQSLEDNINNELDTYIQYRIQITYKEVVNKSTQFIIKIIHKHTGQNIVFDNLSGYEKAIVQFVTMHIINSFSSYRFNLFYIDEAFDVFDENNFNKYISHLLQIAADYTQNVLFVTHRSLPSNSTYDLKTITQINGTSHI